MKNTGKKTTSIKKVILVRHSHAEDQSNQFPDLLRSLTVKGKRHSRLMANILKSKEEDPGLMITSPAFRAYETALIFSEVYALDSDRIRLCKELYSGMDNNDIISFFRDQSDDVSTVTIFGHNSLISDMAGILSADGAETLPKTGIISLSFMSDKWNLLKPGTGNINYFLKPKSLL
jgi:phosphohistidine phosphatase